MVLLSRAIAVGDRVRLHSGTLGGPFEGTITEVGLVHTHLRTADAPLWIPNTHMLGAAIATRTASRPANRAHPDPQTSSSTSETNGPRRDQPHHPPRDRPRHRLGQRTREGLPAPG